jgi:hypothetical protein
MCWESLGLHEQSRQSLQILASDTNEMEDQELAFASRCFISKRRIGDLIPNTSEGDGHGRSCNKRLTLTLF